MDKGYGCPIWFTFDQAKEAGGYVKKGEKGTTVVYASSFEKTDTDAESGEETTEKIPFLKATFTGPSISSTNGSPSPARSSPPLP